MKKVKKLKSRLTKISNVEFAKGLFEAHKTDTPLDGLFSIDGGVPKATNWMVVGAVVRFCSYQQKCLQ